MWYVVRQKQGVGPGCIKGIWLIGGGQDKMWRRPLIKSHYKIPTSRLKGIKRDGAQAPNEPQQQPRQKQQWVLHQSHTATIFVRTVTVTVPNNKKGNKHLKEPCHGNCVFEWKLEKSLKFYFISAALSIALAVCLYGNYFCCRW